MSQDPRLERYLTSLESALKPFPVSDRAEIITEIRSHVLSALERDPQTRLDTVLSSLGEPETVANRYLLERGMKPAKTSISPIVKWLVIGFLGTFAMVLVFTAFLIGHFGSILKVDGKNNRVQVLGGLVDIDGNGGSGDAEIGGKFALPNGGSVAVRFGNGKVDVSSADGRDFKWSCKGESEEKPAVQTSASGAMLDLSRLPSADCSLEVPIGARVALSGGNGKVELNSPRFDLDVELGTGEVEFERAENASYVFDVKVALGKADPFESSSQPGAHVVKIRVASGSVTNEQN